MYSLPTLPYAYDSLAPYIDEETMHIHHDKHHAAYVKNLNDAMTTVSGFEDLSVTELLRKASELPETVRQKIINNAGGHANHTLYWETLGEKRDQKPEGALAQAIDATFGSYDALKEKLTAVSVGRFGSGWGWLALDKGTLVVVDTVNQDSPILKGMTPLFGIDVWEHAYYLSYRNLRVDYVNALWHVVNWERIGELYEQAKK